jgi:hypothetical protein
MMMGSLRCVLASRLLLDHQLHGPRLSGSAGLAPEIRKTVEDATLVAYERIIDACLVHDVDCLLISGDSFDPDDRSLRGPAALIRGIQRLAERDIPVILQSDKRDLWSSWPAGLRFPPNAHRLGAGFESRVAVARQGNLLATISASSGDEPDAAAPSPGWRIQFPDPSGTPRMVPLTYDPGPVQGIRASETGSHGGVLIAIDAGGETRETLIPAAAVRWERFEINVAAGTSRDDLLQEMAGLLEQTPRKPCEKVWLVGWDLSGDGELVERLANTADRDGLLADLAGLEPITGVHLHSHSLRVHPPAGSRWPIDEHDGLAVEYGARLDERFARPDAGLPERLAGIARPEAVGGGPWKEKIDRALAGIDAAEVAHEARRLATQWFASTEEVAS